MNHRGTVLVLWNQVEEDIYEQWRREGPRPLAWDPERLVPDVGTVAEEMDAMIRALVECGYRVHLVNIEDDLDRLISAIRLYRPDMVMNLVEYFNDDAVQEAYVAGLYEMMGVCYTGNRPLTLSTCQNKYRTKVILEAAGLPTSPYILIEKEPIPTDHELSFPLIVKPTMEDASGGIEHSSVVQDQAALEDQVRRVMKEYEMPVLVEEYIDGREIHAALLGNAPPEVLPLFEMEFDDSEFNPGSEWRPQIISYRAKWDPHSKEFYSMDSVCPAEELDEEIEDYIRDIAIRAFKAMGCRDYARIDMRVDEEEGEVYILEVNPNPDLADGAAYMQCAAASGRTFTRTLGEIIEMAMERARKATIVDSARANLPSDHLMREWVVSQRAGRRTTLPLSGSPAARRDDAVPAGAPGGPADAASPDGIGGAADAASPDGTAGAAGVMAAPDASAGLADAVLPADPADPAAASSLATPSRAEAERPDSSASASALGSDGNAAASRDVTGATGAAIDCDRDSESGTASRASGGPDNGIAEGADDASALAAAAPSGDHTAGGPISSSPSAPATALADGHEPDARPHNQAIAEDTNDAHDPEPTRSQ